MGNLYLHYLVFKHLLQPGLLIQLFPFSTISLFFTSFSVVSKSSYNLLIGSVSAYKHSLARIRVAGSKAVGSGLLWPN